MNMIMYPTIKSLIEKERFDEAKAKLKQLDRKMDNNPWISYYRSYIFERTGDLEKALTLVNSLQDEGSILKIGSKVILGYVFWKKGQFEMAMEHIAEGLQYSDRSVDTEKNPSDFMEMTGSVDTVSKQTKNDTPRDYTGFGTEYEINIQVQEWRSTLYNLHGNIQWKKGELDQAIKLHHQALKIRKKITQPRLVVHSLNNIGTIYFSRGELDEALNYFNQGLNYLKKSLNAEEDRKNEIVLSTLYSNIASIYSNYGDLKRALFYNKKALVIRKELDNKQDISYSLNNLGVVFYRKGKYNKALEYFKEALALREEYGNPTEIATTTANIGQIYYFKNQFNRAKKIFKRSLELRLETDHEIGLAKSYYWLTRIAIQQENDSIIKEYGNKFNEVAKSSDNRIIMDYQILIQAMLALYNGRLEDIANAQESLYQLVEGPTRRYNLSITATLLLTEFLLQEIKIVDDNEEEPIYQEIQDLIHQIYQIGQQEKSYPLLIEVLILRGKLFLIKGEIDQVEMLYYQAEIYAKENELSFYQKKIERLKEEFRKDLKRWNQLSDSSFSERLEKSRILEYLSALGSQIE